jgi:ribosomal protein S1
MVKVKVNELNGHRISLSMKDVDQKTGEDISERRGGESLRLELIVLD